MLTVKELLARIEKFCMETGMKETVFSARVAKYSGLVDRLRSGGDLTLTMANKCISFIEQNQKKDAV